MGDLSGVFGARAFNTSPNYALWSLLAEVWWSVTALLYAGVAVLCKTNTLKPCCFLVWQVIVHLHGEQSNPSWAPRVTRVTTAGSPGSPQGHRSVTPASLLLPG